MILTVTDNDGETASDAVVITVGAEGCVTHAECDDGVFYNGAATCDEVSGCTHTLIAQCVSPGRPNDPRGLGLILPMHGLELGLLIQIAAGIGM